MEVREGGLDHPAVRDLIALHVAFGQAERPPENAHAIDAAALADPRVTFVAAWEGDRLAGIAALRALSPDRAELKSMRTHPDYLRRGVARALLAHFIALARRRGFASVSLETGTGQRFAPASALYEAFGFVDCPAFGGYPASPHNRFMTLAL